MLLEPRRLLRDVGAEAAQTRPVPLVELLGDPVDGPVGPPEVRHAPQEADARRGGGRPLQPLAGQPEHGAEEAAVYALELRGEEPRKQGERLSSESILPGTRFADEDAAQAEVAACDGLWGPGPPGSTSAFQNT